MADKPLQLVNNRPTEVEATVVSTGVAQAGDVVALDAAGKLDLSLMPAGIGPDVQVIEAGEALAAGDFVNIYDDTGALVRKADASAPNAGEIAHGFVLDNYALGVNATVYFEGTNDQVSGLTPGVTYVLDAATPGGVVPLAAGTTTAGHSLQVVGVATAAGSLNVEIQKPYIRG